MLSRSSLHGLLVSRWVFLLDAFFLRSLARSVAGDGKQRGSCDLFSNRRDARVRVQAAMPLPPRHPPRRFCPARFSAITISDASFHRNRNFLLRLQKPV